MRAASFIFPVPLWAFVASLVACRCKQKVLLGLVTRIKRYFLDFLPCGCVEARFSARFWVGNIGNTYKTLIKGLLDKGEFYV